MIQDKHFGRRTNGLTLGAPFDVDLERLIGGHLGVFAGSGGGKSGAIRRLLETTHGQVQHLALDVEDEFYTLRERFDYVIAGGDGGDVPATPDNAAALALTALEHGFSMILQLNDLGPDGMPAFIGEFLLALIAAPKSLWRPLLVVVDEAQRSAPSMGSTAATDGVRALISQGRKRGFTGVLATQRVSDLNAAIRGGLNNKMIGRASTALDRKTSAGELGFTANSKEAGQLTSLTQSFWMMGPALALEPTLVHVDDAATTILKPGRPKPPTPPAADALSKILSGLAQETQPAPEAASGGGGGERASADPEALKRAEVEGYRRGFQEAGAKVPAMLRAARLEGGLDFMKRLQGAFDVAQADFLAANPKAQPPQDEGVEPEATSPAPAPPSAPPAATQKPPAGRLTEEAGITDLSEGAANLVNAARFAAIVAQTWAEAAILGGRMPNGGHFEASRRELRDAGWHVPDNDLFDPADQDAATFSWVIDRLAPKVAGGKRSKAADPGFRLLADKGPLDRAGFAAWMSLQPRGGHFEHLWRTLRQSILTEELPDGRLTLIPTLTRLKAACP